MTTSEQNLRYRNKRRAKAIAYLGGECADCGDIEKLEFHHKDPSTKTHNVNYLLTRKWEVLVVELDKCVLLCKFCHRLESNLDRYDDSALRRNKSYQATMKQARRLLVGR